MSAIRTVITEETRTGGFITTMVIDGHDVYVCQPKDVMEADIINYAYSAPLLMVFGEGKFTCEGAVDYAEATGLAQIASENGGFVVFVNPADTWENEPEGIYEAVVSKTKVKQWGFSHGILYDDKKPRNRFEEAFTKMPGYDPVPEYFIFGSPVATYVYACGAGADYMARYYLREVKGKASMGDLGMADVTMTGITLQNLSIVPEVTCHDVSIVSVGNAPEINAALTTSNNRVAVEEELDVIRQYDAYIGDYKRWAGRIRKSINYRKEGIIMKPERMMVNTVDNHQFTTPQHEVGYVMFYDKDIDLQDRNVLYPLVLCFHGGGDTAIATAIIGEWPQIAKENGFILCAVEMHLGVTASETMEIVRDLVKRYPIDTTRLYATGFSMGGIKSWDFYQEFPECFAAIAPMDATVDVGENTQFTKSWKVNEDIMLPVFYNAGEQSPLAEAPFQEAKCVNRMAYTFRVNKVVKPYDVKFEDKDNWEDRIYGVCGDTVETFHDPDFPDSVTTIRSYVSEDGNVYTKLCSISHHQHEIRPFTCRKAYQFMKQFRRNEKGEIEIG